MDNCAPANAIAQHSSGRDGKSICSSSSEFKSGNHGGDIGRNSANPTIRTKFPQKMLDADENSYVLWCWIFSQDLDQMFEVQVLKNENVATLIQDLRRTRNLSGTLHLWRVSIAEDDIDKQLANISHPSEIAGCLKLTPMRPISRAFPDPPNRDHLHIVIQGELPGFMSRSLFYVDIVMLSISGW